MNKDGIGELIGAQLAVVAYTWLWQIMIIQMQFLVALISFHIDI